MLKGVAGVFFGFGSAAMLEMNVSGAVERAKDLNDTFTPRCFDADAIVEVEKKIISVGHEVGPVADATHSALSKRTHYSITDVEA